jgi:hypothetical protein
MYRLAALTLALVAGLPVTAGAQPAAKAAAKSPYVVRAADTILERGSVPHYIRAGSSGRVGGVGSSGRLQVEVSDRAGKILFAKSFTGELTSRDVSSAVSNPAGDHLALKVGDRLTIFRRNAAGLHEQVAIGGRYHRVMRGLNGKELVRDYTWSPDGRHLVMAYVDRRATTNGKQPMQYLVYDAKTDAVRELARFEQGTEGTSPGLFSPSSELVGLVDDLGNYLNVFRIATGEKVASHPLVGKDLLGFNVAGTDPSRFGIDDRGGLIRR